MAGRKRVSKTPLSQRLAAASEPLGIDVLAERTGTKVRTLEDYLRGDSVPDADFLRKFVETTGADPVVLLMGDFAPKNDSDEADGEVATALVDRFKLQVSAGGGSADVAVPASPMPFGVDWLRRHAIKATDLSVLEVRGDSMEPVLYAGDAILVDKAKSKPQTGKMYVVVRQLGVQVKWVHVGRKNVTLISENGEGHDPEKLDPRELPEPEFYRVRWFGHFLD